MTILMYIYDSEYFTFVVVDPPPPFYVLSFLPLRNLALLKTNGEFFMFVKISNWFIQLKTKSNTHTF